MRAVLSPAESLGLAGATLEGRIRRAAQHVSDRTFAAIAERLKADALANAMIYERDGEIEPIRIMLRPLLAMEEQLRYVHHVCLVLTEALKRMPSLYLEDHHVRRILAITPEEEDWFRAAWTPQHQRLNPVYGRLDAACDFPAAQWRDSLRFMEPNLSGVGGIHYAPLAEQLVMRDVVPTLLAHDPELDLELPRDQRELFLQVLMDHARALGREACLLCLVEPKYVHDGPNEQSMLSQVLASRYDLTVGHADPRELIKVGDEVYHRDSRIDVAYRDYELRDLIALERELGRPLEAMRHLFRQNQVVSSLAGDFDHKSCFEVLTDPSIAGRHFNNDERQLFRRHVLWTRVVSDRRTTLPDDGEGGLLDYALKHREMLVLKPNRGYGGSGVHLGAATEPSQWGSLIEKAAKLAGHPENSWVVQLATRLPVYEFPVVGADGRVFGEPYYAVMGFCATDNGLGAMCRVSQKQVVNVAQRGGLAALLEANSPPELRIPKRSMIRRVEGLEQTLRARIRELKHLDHAIALLGWDEETMLPAGARDERGEQLATLEGLRHAMLVSDHLGDLIEEVAEEAIGNEPLMRELTLLRRLRRNALALPESLVRRFANAKSKALGAWEEARARNDFQIFAPAFESLLKLIRERAQALANGPDPYDALLGEFEHGMTRSRLDPVLSEVRSVLVPLVQQAAQMQRADPPLARRTFPKAQQWDLCRRILSEIGFDFARGRLDESSHPFTLLAGVHDVRLTIRVREDNLASSVLTLLHEGGHGLYDQGFAIEDRDTLLAEAPSMGMHEAQSRLWENHIGRSLVFWEHLMPIIGSLFGNAAVGLDAAAFRAAVTRVDPQARRVDADEMSYHLHIVLRYELEIALLSGALEAADLPAAWTGKSLALFGAAPASDRDGVLQDVHWSLGMFGYFPTYTLGSLYAAQLAEAYARSHPLEDEVRAGEFANLLEWLRRHVHRLGNRYSAEEIVSRATGIGLDAAAFFRHVKSLLGTP